MIRLVHTLALGAVLLMPPLHLLASDEIAFSPQQIEALGIGTLRPTPVQDAAGSLLAARVVIPPDQETVVAAPLSGLVERLQVAEAQAVTAGQALVQIRSPELLELQRAYLEAVSRDRLIGKQLKRDEDLYREGIIAERRLLETRSLASESRTTRDAQRQVLELSGVSGLDLEALANSGRISPTLILRAPRDGVILELMTVTGERLEASAPILRIADLERLWLELRLPIEQLATLDVGAAVTTADGSARGRVRLIGGTVQAGDDTVLVRVEIESGAERLRPGQFVQARALGIQGNDSFRVPAAAVVRRGDQDIVFLRRVAGFEPVSVTRVSAEDGHLVVRGPLRADDEVAVSGVATIKAAWMGIGGGE